MNNSGLIHIQVVEIDLDDDGYKGMPFVLRRGETWIKNNDSDFYLDLKTKVTKKPKAILLIFVALRLKLFLCSTLVQLLDLYSYIYS
jgi:hypothetical protein